MIFTVMELAGMAAICSDGSIPGVRPAGTGVEQAQTAMSGLTAKGVLGPDGRATRFGVVPIRALEQYCQAERHLFINQLKLSLNPDGALTVLLPVREDWNLARMSPWAMMTALLKGFPFLRLGGTDTAEGAWEPLSIAQWTARFEDAAPEQVLVVRAVDRPAGRSQTMAYTLFNGTGFAYDLDLHRAQSLPVGLIRVRLADLLGCDPNHETGGSDD